MTRRRSVGARGRPAPSVASVAAAAVVAATMVLGGCSSAAPDGGSGDSTARPASNAVVVYAAASLAEVFAELETRFEEAHPRTDIVVDTGGSAALAQRIVLGGGADVFAAASPETMAVVEEAGLAPDPRRFARNSLALVVPPGNPAGVTGLADLARPDLVVALCDPVVPCGAVAETLLADEGVSAVPDTLEQDVASVLAKIALGEADAGLVYRTDVRAADGAVDEVPVPGVGRVETRYPIAVLTDAADPAAAREWVEFVLSDAARGVLADAGFGAP